MAVFLPLFFTIFQLGWNQGEELARVAFVQDQGTVNGSSAVDLLNSLGLPVGFLALTLGAVRVMWKSMSERNQEALKREIENTQHERARADRLETALADLNKTVRDQVMPTLERAATAMARELTQRRAEGP